MEIERRGQPRVRCEQLVASFLGDPVIQVSLSKILCLQSLLELFLCYMIVCDWLASLMGSLREKPLGRSQTYVLVVKRQKRECFSCLVPFSHWFGRAGGIALQWYLFPFGFCSREEETCSSKKKDVDSPKAGFREIEDLPLSICMPFLLGSQNVGSSVQNYCRGFG